MVFALNGLAVGALQLLGMRHLVRLLGKHVMLIAGNVLLAAGMVGVALSRKPAVHFAVRESSVLATTLYPSLTENAYALHRARSRICNIQIR